MGRREFVARVAGLSAESRFMTAWHHGQGPEPSAEESAALLDRI